MNLVEKSIFFANENLTLTNQRVVYWASKNILILSDLHLGKAAHFRKNGIPVPVQISLEDLNRLNLLINYFQPKQVLIVGDLIHAGANNELDFFKELIQNHHQTKFILIKGNHDRISENKLNSLGIYHIFKELVIDNLHFIHQPESSKYQTISGHVHPGINVEFATKRMRFPCYVVTENQLILPAFSAFTGLDASSILENQICYAFHEEGIFEI
ncbi:ligase-associated DNA damage response endonuclease PdeM [Moheibacter sediminis]|uniref:Putative phosphoesterase n=1 Tax=Moheibacter sediminis TaxID=1434700 RepID=A0A1W1ZAK6_9FLAO|nr:ligase-associated DNA damage response endonuclease PdeM [Moheibacter sediminis]SMC45463.1 putative phosphoesterase [Moheibacter sediminis]